MIPYFKKRGYTDKYFTVHPNANIQFDYVPWVVSDRAVDPVNDLSHISLKTQVRRNKHEQKSMDRYSYLLIYIYLFAIARTGKAWSARGTPHLTAWSGNTEPRGTPGKWMIVSLFSV